jgi:hypothetical protein
MLREILGEILRHCFARGLDRQKFRSSEPVRLGGLSPKGPLAPQRRACRLIDAICDRREVDARPDIVLEHHDAMDVPPSVFLPLPYCDALAVALREHPCPEPIEAPGSFRFQRHRFREGERQEPHTLDAVPLDEPLRLVGNDVRHFRVPGLEQLGGNVLGPAADPVALPV